MEMKISSRTTVTFDFTAKALIIMLDFKIDGRKYTHTLVF